MASTQIMEVKGELTTRLTNGFRCHPNYGNDMRKQYNIQLNAIAKSNLLSDIVSQLIGKTVTANKMDPSMTTDILEADYTLS